LRRNRGLWTRIAGFRSKAPRSARCAPAAHPCRSARRHDVLAQTRLRDECRADLPPLLDLPRNAHVTLYYEPGIQWRGFRRAHEVVAGVGINRQIRRAYLFLARNYRPGDRVVLMGYSRGAYAVRSLAGLIDRMGLLRAAQIDEETLDRIYISIARRRKPGGAGAEGCAVPRACRDRVSRRLRHGARAGDPLADPLALRGDAAPYHSHALGPATPDRAARAGAERDARRL
jgi:hypothetical protein